MNVTNGAEALTFCKHLQLAIAKSRSVAVENTGGEIAKLVSPELFEGYHLGLLEILVDRDEPVAFGDYYNLLILVGDSLIIPLGYSLMWQEDFPDRTDSTTLKPWSMD